MPLNSIEGKWAGESKFDQGYPLALQVVYVAFEMDLTDQDGIITGTCHDEHTRHFNLPPATIEGTFKNNIISLVKTQPCFIGFNEQHETYADRDKPGSRAVLTGKLRKKLFGSGYYFKGQSTNSISYTDKRGQQRTHTLTILWSMKKMQ